MTDIVPTWVQVIVGGILTMIAFGYLRRRLRVSQMPSVRYMTKVLKSTDSFLLAVRPSSFPLVN